MLVDEFIRGNSSLQSIIEDYLHAQAVIQTIINPSGSLYTGAGLGEPKFNINVTAFKGSWGRPQRDGPALRAIALMNYINWLTQNGKTSEAKNVIWPIVSFSSIKT
jgi:glucoamylase